MFIHNNKINPNPSISTKTVSHIKTFIIHRPASILWFQLLQITNNILIKINFQKMDEVIADNYDIMSHQNKPNKHGKIIFHRSII